MTRPGAGDSHPASTEQVRVNAELWEAGEHVDLYANRSLAPVEVLILVRYREALSGRVIEVGCGAGRVLGYLAQLGREVFGVDLSPAMVEYCRRVYPQAVVVTGDVSALGLVVEGPFDVIFAANNLLDVFDDRERRSVLAGFRALLAPDGLLIFSSHNLAKLDRADASGEAGAGRGAGRAVLGKLLEKPPADLARAASRLPRRLRNRRRLAPLQRRAADHAIVNDETFDYGLLHYYIRRDDQERQLAEVGFELVECLDPDGRTVEAGNDGRGPWLHYVARAAHAHRIDEPG